MYPPIKTFPFLVIISLIQSFCKTKVTVEEVHESSGKSCRTVVLYLRFGIVQCFEFVRRHVFKLKIKIYRFEGHDPYSSLDKRIMVTPTEMGQIVEGNLDLCRAHISRRFPYPFT